MAVRLMFSLYFYPRSPCGERLRYLPANPGECYFYPRSPCGERLQRQIEFERYSDISIHALLAESDRLPRSGTARDMYFYPRSPCGERPRAPPTVDPLAHFYPRSPCGERLSPVPKASFTCWIFLSTLSLRRATTRTLLWRRPKLFLSTLSLRRATLDTLFDEDSQDISIHALLAESDASCRCGCCLRWHFYPRSPCGERLDHQRACIFAGYFYPRSPCGERLLADCTKFYPIGISIHALLAESDRLMKERTINWHQFLSTLSLRRATQQKCGDGKADVNFYPRSPCGERPGLGVGLYLVTEISIHALLAESDGVTVLGIQHRVGISIHALLAESDASCRCGCCLRWHFYPRSPCGERLDHQRACIFAGYFYPRSPCGERLLADCTKFYPIGISIHALLAESDRLMKERTINWHQFLSTLSLRRATQQKCGDGKADVNFYPRSPCGERPGLGVGLYLVTGISIHALLAESDQIPHRGRNPGPRFLSTLSLRRATVVAYFFAPQVIFLSTLSLRRATPSQCRTLASGIYDFYPRSPCGERHLVGQMEDKRGPISIHALLAESDHSEAVPCGPHAHISIHALLAESDNDGVALIPHH